MQGKQRCIRQSDLANDLITYCFEPTLFCLVPQQIKHSFSITERIRLLLRVLRGYLVYYQMSGNTMASYCFIKKNYLCKYAFLEKRDVLINPYYVSADFRGCGLGGQLIRVAIDDKQTDWDRVFAVVKEDNFPSIRTLDKLGFERIGFSRKKGWSHKLTANKTHLLLFSLTRSEGQEKQHDISD